MRNELKINTPSLGQGTELTVLAPIKPGFVPSLDSVTYKTRTKLLLKTLHSGRRGQHEYQLFRALSDATERVAAIHTLRVAVIEPENKILLSVNFDGAFEAYVRVIWQKASRLLDLIFCNTVDYPTGWDHSFAEWSQWLRSVQVEVPFFYAAPDRTMQDGQLLRMQERAYRRIAPAGGAADGVDLLVTQLSVPSAERIAWGIVCNSADPTSTPGKPQPAMNAGKHAGVRQGLQTLAGLYRLAEVYPPGTQDGVVLHRAARELMPELVRMQFFDTAYGKSIDDASGGRFTEALAWLKQDVDLLDTPVTRKPPVLPDNRTRVFDDQIQGGILRPYQPVTQGCLCLLAFDHPAAVVGLLERLKPAGGITTEADTADTADMRAERVRLTRNLAFTAEGLRACGLDEAQLDWLPIEFRQGMESRAGLLGDVRGNHPRRWKLPLQNWPEALDPDWIAAETWPRISMAAVHAVLQVRLIDPLDPSDISNTPTAPITDLLRSLFNGALLEAGVRPLSLQWMAREAGLNPVDHFGFIDGQSEPKFSKPETPWPTYPNHVHLGEALVGHANAADAETSLAQDRLGDRGRLLFNGSYLVIRKLRQNVDVLQQAVSRVPPALDPDVVLAKMMGRWPARTVGKGGQPLLSTTAGYPNDFNYNSDPLAEKCPFAAHIRRANPRQVQILKSQVGAVVIDTPGGRAPRLFRQSMPYGKRLAWPRPAKTGTEAAKPLDDADRGLMFMAYGASIAEQFEVVQRWLAGGNSAGGFSGEADPFIGVPESGRKRYFRFEDSGQVHRLWLDGNDELGDEPRPLVELQWGAYLFVPSLDGLAYLHGQAQAAAAGRTTVPWSVARGTAEITRLRAVEAAQGLEVGALAWKAALEDPDAVDHYTSASVWAAIRAQHGGLLRIPYGVLVAGRSQVDELLLDPQRRYTVAGYQQRLEHSIGPIFLGLDDGADGQYQLQSAACNRELQDITIEEAFVLSRASADRALDCYIQKAKDNAVWFTERRWELNLDVRELIDEVLADLVEKWVGISEKGQHFQRGGMRWFGDTDPSSLPLYPGWFTSPSRCTFQPLPELLVEKIAQRQGQRLRQAMTAFLDEFGSKILGRVAQAVLKQTPPLSTDLAARTLIGVMMGFLPAAAGNIRRVVSEWMGDGSFWTLRSACTGNESVAEALMLLKMPLHRAMQARPVPELIWRTAVRRHWLGTGTDAVLVEAGDMLILGLGSAAHQGIETGGAPDVSPIFGGRRDANVPSPTHACPGYKAAIGAMVGLLYAVLARRDALRPGPAPSVLSFEGVMNQPAPKPPTVLLETAMTSHPLTTLTLALEAAMVSAMSLPSEVVGGGVDNIGEPTTPVTGLAAAPATPGSLGVLLGVGDSWIMNTSDDTADFADALTTLGYDTSSFKDTSGEGLTLRDQAALPPDPSQPGIYQVLDSAIKDAGDDPSKLPKALLISVSGNDIHVTVDDYGKPDRSPLAQIVLPAGSTQMLDPIELERFVNQRLRNDLILLLDNLLNLTKAVDYRIPIILHGYDYPIPDGRHYGTDPKKSWLYSVITHLHHHPWDTDGRSIMKTLIDALNTMMAQVATTYADRGVRHAKLTGTLKAADYTQDWLNELHPTKQAFDQLAQVLRQQF